jgi:hypothetical protein
VNRAWDTVPVTFEVCGPAILTATLDSMPFPPLGPPFSMVNVLVYSQERDPTNFCNFVIDTSSKNINNQFQGEFQDVGRSYTFVERSTGDPFVFEAGTTYYVYAHVSASFAGGPADVTFEFSNP